MVSYFLNDISRLWRGPNKVSEVFMHELANQKTKLRLRMVESF